MTKPFLFTLLLFSVTFLSAQDNANWPEPTQTSKPWTRWWWMNNGVDGEGITRELTELSKMGIGGVEITPIYGVKGEEHRTIEYLSSDFSEILDFAIDEAARVNMGVDLPPGSGWRCGAPFVPEEKGLWNLQIERIELTKGEDWDLPEEKKSIAAVSFSSKGVIKVLPISSFTAPGNGILYVAYRIKSGNKVKRPAVGGEGWAIDTFNGEITNWFLSEFWTRLGISEGKLRCFFHDSFEYTGDFTTHFLSEFKTRRGYNLAEYLHVLAGDCKEEETLARIKSDYRETLADLVLESFIQPMTKWANQHQSLNRNQAHGSPGNILDLYAACDIPETEIFKEVKLGDVDVFVNKFASSAAHVSGKKLISSESFTWLEEHWTVTPSDMVRATNRFFLAGVNHMFFHGTCYSPADATWPGWLFYASTQLNNRNPLWREMPTLFKYIERTQNILQQSTPQSDLLIYWPYYDVAASEGRIFNHLGVNKDAGWFIKHPISGLSERLMAAGYTFDYISDKQLLKCDILDANIVSEGKALYKAIVIPETNFIPVKTMQKLVEFIKAGGKVYFDERLPQSVPGMLNLEERELQLSDLKAQIDIVKQCGEVTDLLEKEQITGESSLAEKGFHYLKFEKDNEDWYLIFNTSLQMKDEWVDLSSAAKSYVFMNPMTGHITAAINKGNKVRIQLQAEELVFIRCAQQSQNMNEYTYFEQNSIKEKIDGHWFVTFLEGGPIYPRNMDMYELKSWTQNGNQEEEHFCGTACYKLDFNWSGEKNGWLDLGEVKDCARVKVNDKNYATLLGPSYHVYVDNLQKGTNELIVEVTNVAANRIRHLDKKGVEWRMFEDINFVNIDYEKFDASEWSVREAGLLGPVRIYLAVKD